jgi:sec-independent protein translocase protein TatB
MNFLGIGPGEILVIFVIMLVVAGPKRMIEWAYHIGRYTSKMRAMFQEAMDAFNRELNVSELTKDLPSIPKSSFDILKEADQVINNTDALDQAASATSKPTPPPAPIIEPPVIPPVDATPITPVTPTEPESGSGEKPENGRPQADAEKPHTDNERPRYDSWLPN